MTDYIDVAFYAQIEPEWEQYAAGDPRLLGAKVARVNQKRPLEPKGGTVLVKLRIRLPRAAFQPLEPEAVVTIADDLVQAFPVQVEAEAP